jgi:hypothetical protein
MSGRTGAMGTGRASASNIRPAIADGQWHSFGNASGSVRSAGAGFDRGGRGFGGGFRGGFGYGCCGFGRGGWGGWGWGGWGWGFGFGWPFWGGFWGPYWGLWDPWWYNPYWYGPGYYGYTDYSYDWSDNPPPYRPDSYNSQDGPDANLSPNYHLSSSLNNGSNNNGSNYGPKNDGSNYGGDSDSTSNYDATLSYSNGWTPFSATGPLR